MSFQPVLVTTWQQGPTLNSISGSTTDDISLLLRHHFLSSPLQIRHTISSPDLLLLFLNKTLSSLNQISFPHLHCLYFPSSSPSPNLTLRPLSADFTHQILRCPLQPPGFLVSVNSSAASTSPPAVLPLNWDFLSYEALIDGTDNSTIVFTKGLNLRPGKLSDPYRYSCDFGWDFSHPRFLISSPVMIAAQELVRCKTPLSVLQRLSSESAVMVSIRDKTRGQILPSVAHVAAISPADRQQNLHQMCVCTMLRNQARFITEWLIYHSRIGVSHWFIYDNNSEDAIEEALKKIPELNFTRYIWPWVKSQEAGFAHCALMARASCEWVGFIDVDEFLFLPSPELSLQEFLQNYTRYPEIAELRTACHTFGPSGRKAAPREGVMVGYTCRTAAPERHKSIVRPTALSSSLVNVVHHFHLREGFKYINIDRSTMVINHYKYQAWEVFKEKFYRRVATYVADWQDEENVGSKDRAPGLGTKPVEPPDWSSRFCEIRDKGLRNRVTKIFIDPSTGLLPWQGS